MSIGLSFPGVPGFPHFRHNARVAWCVTHAQADYQDLYVERFSSDKTPNYEFRGQWKKAEVRQEKIKVKGGKVHELEVTVVITARSSPEVRERVMAWPSDTRLPRPPTWALNASCP